MRLPDVDIGLDHAPECIYQRHNHTGMTAGAETTVDTIATRHIQDYSLAPSTNAPSEHGARLPDYREPPLGFFEAGQGDMGQQPTTSGPGGHPQKLIWGLSREASMLVSTCKFLSDVVFQDLPAEIFLQRPNIVKNLLSLLSGPIKEGGVARLQAVRTLADYVTCLRSRIRCHQDPNFYTAKQDFSTTPTPFSTPSSSSSANQNGGGDGRPSVIGWTDSRPRGDGRDGDTTGSSTGTSRASSVGLSPEGRRGESIDLEDVPALQYLQLTLPQFCTQVLERALPLLRSTDQSEKLIESLDVMADLLKFHHHSNLKSDPDDTNHDPGDLVPHRQCLIGLHVLLARILDPVVPVDKTNLSVLKASEPGSTSCEKSYTSVNTVLGTNILAMLETKPSTSISDITQGEKLRGTLRCMLSTDLKVQSEALKRLSWYLSNEEGGVRRLPIFSELNVTDLANLLIVDTPRSVDNDLGRSVFQRGGGGNSIISKLWCDHCYHRFRKTVKILTRNKHFLIK
ncbi:RTTN-like protein, partial [Mya arenaria]